MKCCSYVTHGRGGGVSSCMVWINIFKKIDQFVLITSFIVHSEETKCENSRCASGGHITPRQLAENLI
jgi:hypothetical protein